MINNTLKMNNRNSVYSIEKSIAFTTKFLVIGINLFLFLTWFFPLYIRYWATLLLITDILYLFFRREFKLKLNTTFVLWWVFLVITIVGLFRSSSTNEAIQFILTLILFLLNYQLLISNNEWITYFLKILYWVTAFFVLGSILQLIIPDVVLSINQLGLSSSQYIEAAMFSNGEMVNGFVYQTGVNAFILSIFLGFCFSKVFTSKNLKIRILNIILYFLTFYLLFLTEKRGMILFNVIIFIFLVSKMTKYKFTSLLPIILFITLFIYILFGTEFGGSLINRTINQGDISSGRFGMFEIMWNDFLQNPILGNGTYTTIEVVSAQNGHNVFLQVLREHGVIGFLVLMSIMLSNFFKTNKYLNYVNKMGNKKIILSISMYIQLLFILWCFTGNPLYDAYPLLLYFVAIALIYKVKEIKNEMVIK